MTTTIALCPGIASRFDRMAIGVRVFEVETFLLVLETLLREHIENCVCQTQHVIHLPMEHFHLVSAGIGERTDNSHDYLLRVRDGIVRPYLRREHAYPVVAVTVQVVNIAAYRADPDIERDEAKRTIAERDGIEYVITALRVFTAAGPLPPTWGELIIELGREPGWSSHKTAGLASKSHEFWLRHCEVAD